MPMTSIAIFGATGNLGRHVVQQALDRGWAVSVVIRAQSRLSRDVASRARVAEIDLASGDIDEIARTVEGLDALVCCAGYVAEGQGFVALIDRVVAAVESLSPHLRPVCWFIGGAALLDLDANGRRGVDLPKVKTTYWPHRVNFERLHRSGLDWQMLCPGPMVDRASVGVDRLRLSLDRLPTPLPAIAGMLPTPLLLPLFAWKVPQLIVPFTDAAAVMLNDIAAGSPTSKRRVGLALPAGMRGHKQRWTARPRTAG